MKHVTTKSERDKQIMQAVVRQFGPVSRVDIHELTHPRLNTISSLVGELLDEGRLMEAGRSDNPMGRKQVLLRLNEEHSFIVGVEFDEELVIAATMNLFPRMISAVKERTHFEGGIEVLTRQLVSCTQRAIDHAKISARPLIGIGIAGPGLINSQDGIVVTSSTIEFLKQVPLKNIFEREFRNPVWVECKLNARAAAESTFGTGEVIKGFIHIDYGTGIGAGVILDGKLVRGHSWAGAEVGHTHAGEDNTACICGSFGCLEATAGAAALMSRIRKAISEGITSPVLALADGDPHKISAWTVLRAASLGDKTCSTIVEQAGNYLGLGLANLVNLFNPSMIVLDYRLELAGQGLLGQIVRVVKQQALSHSTKDLEIRFGKLGEKAGVLGLGLMLLDGHFEIPRLKSPRFMIESVSKPARYSAATPSRSLRIGSSLPHVAQRTMEPNFCEAGGFHEAVGKS